MKRFVIANWKMLPQTLAEAGEIVERVDGWLGELNGHVPLNIVLCPPFIFLEEVAQRLQEGRLISAVQLGAQDIAASDVPGQTGEVGGAQLAALGVRYVIIGHSERRALGESDATVHAKLLEALHHHLTPVLCVGETSRDAGWEKRLAAQAQSALEGLDGPDLARVILAYEPVWAISTNLGARPDTPESAAGAAAILRTAISYSSPLLYGGSVTPVNAAGFLNHRAFNGVLVGGASVRADDFVRILQESL